MKKQGMLLAGLMVVALPLDRPVSRFVEHHPGVLIIALLMILFFCAPLFGRRR